MARQNKIDVVSDAIILGAIPDLISLPGMLKASPVEVGGKRCLYIEASNESVDRQGEVILQKALSQSSDFYLRHGNVDLAHFSIMGPKAGIPNYLEYEIGKPLAVNVDGPRTFVKAELYSGESAMAHNAGMVWESLTRQNPPKRWYPSVGGAVLSKSVKIDLKTGDRIGVVDKVRWSNIGLTATPVNSEVPEVSAAPIGMFAKGLDAWVMVKSLDAGYGTDSATLTGGAALRTQSLYGAKSGPMNYFDLRNRLSGDLSQGEVENPTSATIQKHLRDKYGLADADAAECTDRFIGDLKGAIHKRAAA
jgi:hypothetical protein